MELSSIKNQFQKENDEILKFMLNERFFEPWLEPLNPDFNAKYSMQAESYIELYITNKCNQACEYCYLYHNDELYPQEVNNKETILTNLEAFYNWIIKNNYHIARIEMFSGEIWHTELGREVLDLTARALMSGLACKFFMIASNGTFIDKDETLQPIQSYIDEFRRYGARLQFSLSIDGAIVEEDNRPLNGGAARSENFYDKVFSFVYHNDFSFHPMVAAYSIEKWPENFKWWRKMYQKYGFKSSIHAALMMLEVRNNDWTEEKIEGYCNFLRVLAKDFYENECEHDKDLTFARFCISDNVFDQDYSYLPWTLSRSLERVGCSISDCLTVRLGDLAICPCHRTAYKKNLYGYFVKNEEGEIVDIVSNNIYFANRILLANNNLCSVKCDNCLYNPYCIKGCFGSQIENSKDAFLPIESVCNLLKAKYRTAAEIYEKYGVLDYIKNMSKEDPYYLVGAEILDFCERVKKESALEKVRKERVAEFEKG